MRPLSAIYGAAVGTRNSLYDSGFLRQRRLNGPVISVGNLSVGGSGKTPFVILLGELLQKRCIRFDVLSRGYRRKTRGALVVDPGGLPADFGDEPLLIARRLKAPVIVAEERYAGGRLAESRFGPQLHLLDDGFQHRQLARDFDIVLVTPDDARDRVLPAGRLREPLSSLRRADAIVLASGASADGLPVERKRAWRVRRGIAPPQVSSKPVAFCGIARPQQFFLQLKTAGITPVAETVFRDHHAYVEQDIRDLRQLAAENGADGYVTTEKDAINLGGLFSALEPLAVVPVRMELVDAERVLDDMLAAIAERCTPVFAAAPR
jgi:tetraacyldisaccharide 4'-kinase